MFSRQRSSNYRDFLIESAELWRDRNANIATVLDYFHMRTDGARLPSRADIDPLQLKEYLPEIALFKLIYAPDGMLDDIHVTLQGTRLDEFYGNIKNHKASEDENPVVMDRVMQSCRHCLTTREPTVVTANALSPNKDFAKITILYVPLSADNAHIDQMFVFNQVRFKGDS